MENGILSPSGSGQPHAQPLLADLKKVIRDLEPSLIDLIGMADALNDCLLFRAEHPEREPAAKYDGACYLSGEIKTIVERLYDAVTGSPAFEHTERPH